MPKKFDLYFPDGFPKNVVGDATSTTYDDLHLAAIEHYHNACLGTPARPIEAASDELGRDVQEIISFMINHGRGQQRAAAIEAELRSLITEWKQSVRQQPTISRTAAKRNGQLCARQELLDTLNRLIACTQIMALDTADLASVAACMSEHANEHQQVMQRHVVKLRNQVVRLLEAS